jgi:dienelactone hydrolase
METTMTNPSSLNRRVFLKGVASATAGALATGFSGHSPLVGAEDLNAAGSAVEAAAVRQNMTGAYGPWLAETVLGDRPGELSLRSGRWTDINAWRTAARRRTWECLAPVDLGGPPAVRVEAQRDFEGLHVEHLSWQLPAGPRTEAVLLKPAGATGRLPGILALHDHGGNKFLGWRKIARTDDSPWAVQEQHQARSYDGLAWANEAARRGYAVLVHDTFPFASRRVRAADVPPRLRGDGIDPEPHDLEGIKKYNAFAASHEHIMEKSLLCAGTTWPGVYVVEDQRALDVLCARADVDAARIGCAGLSGGGMRTVFLGGLDDRVRCAIAVGFMTTWREFLLDKCFTHTWMTYVPLLPKQLDFPEILGLRAPAATMVLNCNEDPLYTLAEMHRADAILRDVFERAGAADRYRCNFYPGGHKFDRPMQADAFAWFDDHLRPRS